MEDKDKKRDPMPPPDATPEEIGEFWDTHSLADYSDETHEVEFQVNLKSRRNLASNESEAADQSDMLSAEQGWQKLKELIQSLDKQHKGRKKGELFEELVSELLGLLLETHFETAKSGYQPIGDAINEERTIVLQTKNYNDETPLDRKEILGDIEEAELELPNLQVYVLAASRTINNRLRNRLGDVEKKTGLDIVPLELTDKLSNLGALCVTFWEDIHGFFGSSNTDREFSDWIEKTKPQTLKKIEELKSRLKQSQQSRNWVQKDTEKYLLKRFGYDSDHSLRFNYSIDLSQATERKSLESKIKEWWCAKGNPVCYLEGEEGMGKSWLAAKCVNPICCDKHIVTFWLDSNRWNGCRSLDDLFQACLETIPGYQDERKIARLKLKMRNIWWHPTLIVLDGVNEVEAIEAAKRILDEYFTHRNQLENRIHFLLTTRPLDAYQNFEHNLWEECHKISVEPFNDVELQDALAQEGLQPNDLPKSLKCIAKIPRYFQTCIRLRELFDSFDNVTVETVLWTDLLYKIKHTDPQVRKKFDWQDIEEAQEDLAKLAQEAKWTNVDDAPQVSVELLIDCFPNYHEIRRDLEEQRIALKAHKRQAKLSKEHILLGWAVHLSNIFDSTKFSDIENLFERFQQELEPIPSEDLRSEALFVALQVTAISPNSDISQDQLSQKRAGLMLAWFNSHNVQKVRERLSFWAGKDSDAYAQVVEFEFRHHNSPNYEDALIAPLAKTWLNKKGDLNRLASRLTKWLLPTYVDSSPDDLVYNPTTGQRFLRENNDVQFHLLDAALSILSQRPDPQFLEPLARCYGILQSNVESDEALSRLQQFDKFDDNLGKLMRWGYTESFLDNLCSSAEQPQTDQPLLKGIDRLKTHLKGVNSPRFNTVIDHIRNHEQILTGESPEVNANRWYHGLDYLAVRTDLDGLCDEDQDEIKKILDYIAVNPKKRLSENLIPWAAKYELESYSKFACDSKINALNPEYPPYVLHATQGLIFQQNDRERITKAILEVKQYLTQGDDSSLRRANLLTEILLFSAPEEVLTDWFEFLSSHELLRGSICYKLLLYLLEQLLPKPIVKLARQKLEELRSSVTDNSPPFNGESKEFSEEEFWYTLYAYGTPVDENSVKFALGELKLRKPDSTGTYPMIRLALSNSKQFFDEMLADESIQEHLFSKNGRRFIPHPYDRGGDVPAYDKLMSLLPQEIVGSFLCSPNRSDDLSQWGKELIQWLCSIFQGAKEDFDYDREMRFSVNSKVLQTWAEQDTSNFLQLANEYLTELSKFPQYSQALSNFTDDIRCLLLRFQPDKAKQYYHQWNSESFKTVYRTRYGVPTLLAELWKVEYCNSPEHRQLRQELLEECLNDEDIMFMTLAALSEGGRDELWSLVKDEYLESDYAKERNLGVSILPWFGTDEAIEKLEGLKLNDSSRWVREHAAWAYEVAQQERGCQEVYRKALQTRDLFRISAVFEQIKPALSPTARWWHREIEKEEFGEEPQDIEPKLAALHYRFWYRWGNNSQTKSNIEVFMRKLREYCRGEKLPVGSTPRIAPWWKPTSDSGS